MEDGTEPDESCVGDGNERCCSASMEELALQWLGRPGWYVTSISIILFLLGCICGNLVALKTSLGKLTNEVELILPVIVCLIFIVSAGANVEMLGRYTSPLGLTAIFAVALSVCARMEFSHITWLRLDTDALEAFPIISFSLTVQPYLLGIAVSTRAPRYISERSTHVGLWICFFIYLSVGVAGSITFGTRVKSDVLENYPAGDMWAFAANVCMVCAIIACAPVNLFPLRASVMDLAGLAGKDYTSTSYVVVTACLVFIPYAIASMQWDLAAIFSLTGNTSCLILCYLLPCLIVLQSPRRIHWIWPGLIIGASLILSYFAI